ncbi:MAG: hypothetical protein ABII82_01900 [Verrucomicrobiota bacterium]
MPQSLAKAGDDAADWTVAVYVEALARRHVALARIWIVTKKLAPRMTPADRRRWNDVYLHQVARLFQIAQYLRNGTAEPPVPRPIGHFPKVPGCVVNKDTILRQMALLPSFVAVLPENDSGEASETVEKALRQLLVRGEKPKDAVLAAKVASRDIVAGFLNDGVAIDQYVLALQDVAKGSRGLAGLSLKDVPWGAMLIAAGAGLATGTAWWLMKNSPKETTR